MKPPEAAREGENARAAAKAAFPLRGHILRARADFLRAAQGTKAATPGFYLQARPSPEGAEGPPAAYRVGFTCSRKIGNAVQRNRAKRRLRALARALLPHQAQPGWDYVLVGRPEVTVARPFAALLSDLEKALTRLHGAAA
jgi:ribonuclease P protein component